MCARCVEQFLRNPGLVQARYLHSHMAETHCRSAAIYQQGKVVLTHVEVSGGDPNNQQVTNNKAKHSKQAIANNKPRRKRKQCKKNLLWPPLNPWLRIVLWVCNLINIILASSMHLMIVLKPRVTTRKAGSEQFRYHGRDCPFFDAKKGLADFFCRVGQ